MEELETDSSALKGIRVAAFEQVLAGPFSTCNLADMGAEVIKIERVWLNRNKRSLTVDVKQKQGREIIYRLIGACDVFFENYAPGVADRLGLGYETLEKLNPRLIYCSISGYGQDGPYRDVKAYDLLIQGEGGIIATTGYPETPAKAGIAIADIAAGMYAALGIVLALYQREKTGRGQRVDISMLESIVSWLGYFPHHYWHRGEEAARVGMRHHYVTPYGPYMARNGEYVNLAVASAQDWEVFCRKVMDRPDLLEDERFASVEARRENRALLEETIESIFLERDHTEWLERLKSAQLPYGEVRGIAKVLAHPQVIARRFIREVDSPVGSVPVVGNPLRLSDSPARFDSIPDLAEDTEPILRELGYDKEAIESFRRDGVI
jgi:crotonobetainyl-CoA:carnitine CoA-transferase CaiB-like acyl-CoA transferase